MGMICVGAILTCSSAFAVDFSDSEKALKKWREVKNYVTADLPLSQVKKVKFNCEIDPQLYPTHPQQDTKVYHRFNWSDFDQSQLRGESSACALSGKFKNSRGTFPCLKADVIYDVIISDLYQDACGNFYRGFWQKKFFKSDESMGTLFSLGRVLYQNPESIFANDLIVAGTYSVNQKQFLYLAQIFNGDLIKIQEARQRIQGLHFLNPETLLYSPLK